MNDPRFCGGPHGFGIQHFGVRGEPRAIAFGGHAEILFREQERGFGGIKPRFGFFPGEPRGSHVKAENRLSLRPGIGKRSRGFFACRRRRKEVTGIRR